MPIRSLHKHQTVNALAKTRKKDQERIKEDSHRLIRTPPTLATPGSCHDISERKKIERN
jgi:hypothetical protein